MTAAMTHLPRYVPAQLAAARAAEERRARMVPTPRPRLVQTEAPGPRLHLRPGERTGPPKVHEVQRAVCIYLGTRLEDMLGKSLHMRDVRPRQIAMYLSHELAWQTFAEIGRRFGGRDHTTAEHGWRKVRANIENDPLTAHALREISEMLR